MARQRWNPTEEQNRVVEAMAAYGTPETEIARVLRISPKTLRKYCREALDTAAIRANDRVKETLFRIATGNARGPMRNTKTGELLADKDGNVLYEVDWRSVASAAQFWVARRCKDAFPPEHAPNGGSSLQTDVAIDPETGKATVTTTAVLILPDNRRTGPTPPLVDD